MWLYHVLHWVQVIDWLLLPIIAYATGVCVDVCGRPPININTCCIIYIYILYTYIRCIYTHIESLIYDICIYFPTQLHQLFFDRLQGLIYTRDGSFYVLKQCLKELKNAAWCDVHDITRPLTLLPENLLAIVKFYRRHVEFGKLEIFMFKSQLKGGKWWKPILQ